MRGMVNGKWHATSDTTIDPSGDLMATLATPAARVAIDRERLAGDPASYLLLAALACPFAHRTLLARTLAKLDALPVRLMHPWLGGPNGWILQETGPQSISGSEGRNPRGRRDVDHARYLWQIFRASDPAYTGRVSVPVLWDREAEAIASSESREIVDAIVATQALRGRLPALRGNDDDSEHSALSDWIGDRVNVGVYRVGFARTQVAYDTAHDALRDALAILETRLTGQRFLLGDVPRVADLMLFATAVRFDAAYHGAFLLLDMLWRDWPNLQAHLRRMMALPGVADTVAFEDYRVHYFDDAAFDVRRSGADERFIVPRTLGDSSVTMGSGIAVANEQRIAS